MPSTDTESAEFFRSTDLLSTNPSGNTPLNTVMEITPAEFEALKKSGEPYELIDVRSEAEYAISNHGGTLVPLETVLDNPDRFRENKKYIFHCMTGSRSAKAIQRLQKNYGFTNLYNIRFWEDARIKIIPEELF